MYFSLTGEKFCLYHKVFKKARKALLKPQKQSKCQLKTNGSFIFDYKLKNVYISLSASKVVYYGKLVFFEVTCTKRLNKLIFWYTKFTMMLLFINYAVIKQTFQKC